MKKTKALIVSVIITLFALPILAQPVSSITVQERTGSAQTNRPITVSRVFARGEIATYPQAVINGTPVATQADIKTRWNDGSVQHAMLSYVDSSFAANATHTVTFQAQSSGNNTGQMDRAAMLAASWGAQIEVTSGTTQTASARQIVTDWNGTGGDLRVRYWLQGAICTQVIVEDRTPTLTYDMGWDAFKPLHPIFVLTFYPGTSAGIKVEMILENMWTTKLEDQSYSLALRTGNPLGANVYTKATFTHSARTRWRKVFYSGTQPGAVNIDYNLAYMAYSQVLPNFDLSQPSSSTGDIAAFNASDRGDINGHAMVLQNMPQTGGRPDIGNIPAWYARYLHTFDPVGGLDMVNGLAAVESYVPIHARESATNRFYDSTHLVNAFGYQWSLDARPTSPAAPDGMVPVGATTNGGWAYDIAHEPALIFVAYLLTGDWYDLEELYFMAQTAIQVAPPGFCIWCRGDQFGYMSYNNQMRGQAWGMRDLAEAAFMAPDGTPEKTYFTQKLNTNIEIEEGHQTITNGTFPPIDPACPGYTPSATTSKWCYGRKVIALNPDKNTTLTNPLIFYSWGNASTGCGETHVSPAGIPADQCINSNSPWQNGFMFVVNGHVQELGFGIGPLNQKTMKFLLHMIQDPAFNPYLSATYVMPTIRNSTNDFYQNWADVLGGFATAWSCGGTTYNLQTFQGWAENCSASGSGDSNVGSPGYPHIMQGAASYLAGLNINDGSLLGINAWNWMLTHVGFQTSFGVNPQFAILPRNISTCSFSPSTLPAGTVGTAYSQTLTASGCGGGTLTWTRTAGSLPTGLSGCTAVTGTTCAITGTPSTATGSPFSFTEQVSDGGSNSFTIAYTVTIAPLLVAPTITSAPTLPQGIVGSAYSFPLVASGTTPLTWSVTVGSLPTGLSLNGSTGVISGTPTATASASFTIQVSNAAGTNSRIFSLTVVFPQSSAPGITTSCPLTTASQGVAYSLQAAATGISPLAWDISVGALPAGLAMSQNGLISGTPTAGGTSSFTLHVTNQAGADSKSCNMTVNSTPVLDYSISSTGPQHIVVGHYGFFNIVGTVLAGSDEAVTPSVTGLPQSVTLDWVNLIKFCCTTYRFGIAGLNPAQITVPNGTTPGTYTITVTYNSNVLHVIRTATHTLIVDAVPAALTTVTPPANTALTGLAQWQANMISFGHTYCTPPLGGPAFEGFVWYYDGTRNYYQIANYTGDPQWLACAQGLDALYRAYVLQVPPTWTGSAGNIPGYHVFPRGLQLGYTNNGVMADSTALQAMQTNGYANFGDVSQVIDFLLSREISYGLETNLETEAIGLARIANFQNVVEVLIGDFDQWFQSQTAPFAQPFMVALAAEALIQYYDVTGDVRVPPLIKLAADQLRTVSYDSLTTSFMYYNQGGTPSSPYDPQCSNYSSSGTGHTCKGPSPDLNLLIVPIYGWVYQHTGDISYRTFGDTIFNAGVSGAFLGAGKQFSQNYRWSEKYVNWRNTGGSVTISGAVVLGGGVTVH